MLTDKRMQLYLTQEDYNHLRDMANERGLSLAAVIREAIHEYLQKAEQRTGWEADPLSKMVGFFAGEKDLSERHDEYLYGLRRRG